MLRRHLPVLLSAFLCAGSLAWAEPKFKASDVGGRSSDLILCDLDGDGLKDLVLLDDTNLSIFYQDRAQGFTRTPQQTFRLEHRPCVVWPAKLGRRAESLLVMTSDGVTELDFTNRTGPPAVFPIIRQTSIIPQTAEDTNAISLRFSVDTGLDWPLLLVPAMDGIHVWQHRDEWAQAQWIGHSVDASLAPTQDRPGYTTVFGIDLSVGDVNGDGRDDLIVRNNVGRSNIYTLYLQQSNGLFSAAPALTYADKAHSYSWLCWADLNHDGNVDLIKSIWLDEPSFIPGHPSGKVSVGIYQAGEHGQIPAEPQQFFRKNDYMPSLPVVDLDGDGYLDLVLGYSLMDSREGIRKELTARQLDYTLKFFFYRPGAGFLAEADSRRDLVIHMDQNDLLVSWGKRQYFERYVKLGGDFNGSGHAALQVREHSDDISVYFFVSREKGFSLKPDLRFSCPEQIHSWQAVDLNNDGVSDLIVKLGNQNGYRIFLSQK